MTEKIIQPKSTTQLPNLMNTPDLRESAVNDLTTVSDDSELIATIYQPVTTVTLNAGGNNYSVDDVLTVIQSGGSGCTVTVTSVAAGVVDGISLTTGGNGYVVENALATTVLPNVGTGCKINITVISDIWVEFAEQISFTAQGLVLSQVGLIWEFTLGAWGEDNDLYAAVLAQIYNVTDGEWTDVGAWFGYMTAYRHGGGTSSGSSTYSYGSPQLMLGFLESGKDYILYLLTWKQRENKGTSDIEIKTSFRQLILQEVKR